MIGMLMAAMTAHHVATVLLGWLSVAVMVLLVAGWFAFAAFSNAKRLTVSDLASLTRRVPRFIGVSLLVVGGLIFASQIVAWAFAGLGYTRSASELLLIVIGIPLGLLIFYCFVRLLAVFNLLLLFDFFLLRRLRDRSQLGDGDEIAIVRRIAGKNRWFHRAFFRLWRSSFSDVLDRVCPPSAGKQSQP